MKRTVIALSLQLLFVPTLFAGSMPPQNNNRISVIEDPIERQRSLASYIGNGIPPISKQTGIKVEEVSGIPASQIPVVIEVVNKVEILSGPATRDSDVNPVLKQAHVNKHGQLTRQHTESLGKAHNHIMVARKATSSQERRDAQLEAMIELMEIEKSAKKRRK